jgi:hypothetical protein
MGGVFPTVEVAAAVAAAVEDDDTTVAEDCWYYPLPSSEEVVLELLQVKISQLRSSAAVVAESHPPYHCSTTLHESFHHNNVMSPYHAVIH